MKEQLDKWTAEYYHLPNDEYDPEWWDLDGLVDDTKLLFKVGYELSNNQDWPQWSETSEFRAAREESMKAGN